MAGKAFNPSELDSFHRQGYLRLNGVHSKARMEALKEKILRELSRLRIWDGGKSIGGSLQSMTPFQQIAKLSSMVKVDVHDVLNIPEIHSAIVGLTDRTPLAEQGSQPLLSLAHQGRWSLNSLNWHVDIASTPTDRIPGVQAFHLIDDVVPHGGATLALARSHRMTAGAFGRLRGSLKKPADIQEVLLASDTEIIEMSGQVGDVFLMDMRVLHTPSINSSKNIRMMATTRFGLRS
ncbi:phytanoyl-CoA dioxygenase family protein [Variovorax arabinosiphilus]|uniref:phytanoyl-CoA dioxygenase family protein n=1 Tax=Variovorax arabinosiphilus TaxID=3053498 RepID=UPI002575F0FE|nr:MULTISPECIES: phytanoyl-CoA dioxygenase family protein [unclassified Variovorax]MDM0123315.1 phytanoyl-CoA dioxygenase family protein [Variovorax sp. J2L1-78]MDM0131689.1 phytanoyl-CoA dioxygenase family protein [Variovorax sp. J2L1-63]MDM0236078.1 phytanoyl-CoA dioxygenase family protein [Variovorax sp. J2R1-6]